MLGRSIKENKEEWICPKVNGDFYYQIMVVSKRHKEESCSKVDAAGPVHLRFHLCLSM